MTTDHTASEVVERATTGDEEAKPWEREWTAEGIKNWNNSVIEEFRANGGKVGGAYEGGDMILLTTTGARSGKRHTVPLGLLADEARLIVSSFIETNYPAWYHNLRANPAVTIERGTEQFAATAIIPVDEDRERLWAQVTETQPLLLEHQAKATIPLPLVIFER